MAASVWGNQDTQYFFQLIPDVILNAIESSTGTRCTGRVMGLNSMENRVYEVEIERDEPSRNRSDDFFIAKFYRPGRWSKEQILEEHEFLNDLVENDIPAIAPLKFQDGTTLHKLDDADIYYTVFPKQGGRSPDELPDKDLGQIGRLLARLHNVGKLKSAPNRIRIHPETYGMDNLAYLLEKKIIPDELESAYSQVVEEICQTSAPWFDQSEYQRIHGDCHLGNLIYGRESYFWVDFDDMVSGPPVQDLWLLLPGRPTDFQDQFNALIDNYDVMKEFDRSSIRLIEPLRALRYVHFSAWIAKRWDDPAFPKAFPEFGTEKYWRTQLMDLMEQKSFIR